MSCPDVMGSCVVMSWEGGREILCITVYFRDRRMRFYTRTHGWFPRSTDAELVASAIDGCRGEQLQCARHGAHQTHGGIGGASVGSGRHAEPAAPALETAHRGTAGGRRAPIRIQHVGPIQQRLDQFLGAEDPTEELVGPLLARADVLNPPRPHWRPLTAEQQEVGRALQGRRTQSAPSALETAHRGTEGGREEVCRRPAGGGMFRTGDRSLLNRRRLR